MLDMHDKMARGLILDLLIKVGMRPQSLYILRKMLEAQAFPMGEQGPQHALRELDAHLVYLSKQGYVRRSAVRARRRLAPTAGHEKGAPLQAQTVRALAKAVRLRDGEIPADPEIVFFEHEGGA